MAAATPSPRLPTPDRATFDVLWLRADLDRRARGLTPGHTLRPAAALGPGPSAVVAVGDGDDEANAEPLGDAELAETWTPPADEAGTQEETVGLDPALAERLGQLPDLLGAGDGDAPPQLALGRVIGEGGMGVVRLARQPALGREVAVKMLRSSLAGTAAARRLLAEAMVAGQLEHPEILPIYALGRDGQGAPLLVLKRVDGVSWSELVRSPQHPLLEGQEPLVWHLQVLMRVCRAVQFAHERHILHRDLKTDNVMVGRHGEIYVLDWGIAVTLGDDASGAIPAARGADELVGTPAVMAPEMVQAQGALLGPHTDVFLLGAMLHELLTARPRYQGRELAAVIFAAYVCEPYAYPPAVPAELAAIAQRACARAPADRYASADELRLALRDYLQHRASNALLASAQERLGEHAEALLRARAALATAVAQEEEEARQTRRRLPEATEATFAALQRAEVAAARLQVEQLTGAARASLQEAARAWPANPAVAKLERRLQLAVAGWQIDCLDIAGAEASLRDLRDGGDDSLRQGLERAAAAVRAHQRAWAQRRDDGDPTIGARTRAFFAVNLGVWFTLAPAAGAAGRSWWGWRPTVATHVGAGIVFLALIGAGALWARQTMFRTRLNRSVVATGAVCGLALTLERLLAVAMGLQLEAVVVLDLYTFGLTVALMAAGAWPRLWLASLVYFAAAVVATLEPASGLWSMAGANLLAMALVAFQWRPADYDDRPWLRWVAQSVAASGRRPRSPKA